MMKRDIHLNPYKYACVCNIPYELAKIQCLKYRHIDKEERKHRPCNQIPIVKDTQEQAEAYAEGLSAEEVYLDMLQKIVDAPTKIHMLMSARMLIPVIDKKLREEGT